MNVGDRMFEWHTDLGVETIRTSGNFGVGEGFFGEGTAFLVRPPAGQVLFKTCTCAQK